MLGKLRYLERKNIDEIKWQQLCAQCEEANVYVQIWYLDEMCEGRWGAIVYGDYEALMPLPYRKKWGIIPYVYQPFFTQQLGMFSLPFLQLNIEEILKAIPKKFVKVDLQIFNFIENFNLKSKRNYILELNNPYDKLVENYNKDARKNLRKCEFLKYDSNIEVEEIVALNKTIWGPLNKGIEQADYDRFVRVCEIAEAHGALIKVQSKLNNELHAAALFLKGGKRLHYLCGAPTAAGKETSAIHGIVDWIIKTNAGKDLILDFEGSELENVASFYRKFGAKEERYYLYNRCWM